MNTYPSEWWQFAVAYVVMGLAILFLLQSSGCIG
jgi:hypothetical protein